MTVNEFWNWFSLNSSELTPTRITSSKVSELQEILNGAVGHIDWEIGPVGTGERSFFALSPTSSDSAVNDASRILIGAAPAIEGWDIQLYKPLREWEMAFSINVGRRRIPIEGERWLIAAVQDRDALWSVTFVCDSEVKMLPDEALLRAAWTILDGELGTLKSRTLIGTVSVSKVAVDGAVPLIRGLLTERFSGSRRQPADPSRDDLEKS